MTIKDTIKDFSDKIGRQLDELDRFLANWNELDWHMRCVILDQLLHGMWSTYEDAEDIAGELKGSFPPYPFTEIKELKKCLKRAKHTIEDFLKDEYMSIDSEEYLSAYKIFMDKICDDNQVSAACYSREQHLAQNERLLLEMLNKSYSVLLELMLSCHQQIQKNDANTILAYGNCKARYDQLEWTDRRDKGAFYRSLEKQFPWGEPTRMQLTELYQDKLKELKKTQIGKLYVDNDHDGFVLGLARLTLSENELHDFFREQAELEELAAMANDKYDGKADNFVGAAEGKKRGAHEQYLFIDGQPTKENVFIKNQEKHRFMQYMKAHNLSSRELSCNKNDRVNDALTCFILHWRDKKLIAEKPSGRAIYRFMRDDCNFKSGVTIDSYANEMSDRIKNKQYTIETYQRVSTCFVK